ncbi:hypothetical protein ES705_23704 [subsurface metagenome]
MYEKYLTLEFLKKEYGENKRGCLDIAKEIGCHRSLVLRYLKKFNIPRRSRLEAISKKREEKKKLTEEEKVKRREKLLAKASIK